MLAAADECLFTLMLLTGHHVPAASPSTASFRQLDIPPPTPAPRPPDNEDDGGGGGGGGGNNTAAITCYVNTINKCSSTGKSPRFGQRWPRGPLVRTLVVYIARVEHAASVAAAQHVPVYSVCEAAAAAAAT